MDKLLLDIANDLKCGICEEYFNGKPMTLECAHSFCEKCLNEKTEFYTRKEEYISCPDCQKTSFIYHIKKDNLKSNLIESIKKCQTIEEGDFKYTESKADKDSIVIAYKFNKNYLGWMHVYIRYSFDNWNTAWNSAKHDIAKPKITEVYGHKLPLPDFAKKIQFAICIYDDFNHSYWDNNKQKNYEIRF